VAAVSLATATTEQKLEEHSIERAAAPVRPFKRRRRAAIAGDLIGYREYARAHRIDTQSHGR